MTAACVHAGKVPAAAHSEAPGSSWRAPPLRFRHFMGAALCYKAGADTGRGIAVLGGSRRLRPCLLQRPPSNSGGAQVGSRMGSPKHPLLPQSPHSRRQEIRARLRLPPQELSDDEESGDGTEAGRSESSCWHGGRGCSGASPPSARPMASASASSPASSLSPLTS